MEAMKAIVDVDAASAFVGSCSRANTGNHSVMIIAGEEVLSGLEKEKKRFGLGPQVDLQVVDPGSDIKDAFRKHRPTLVLPYLGDETSKNETLDYLFDLQDLANSGTTVVHFDKMYDTTINKFQGDLKFYTCRGDLCFLTNDDDVATTIIQWSWTNEKHKAPRGIGDLFTPEFGALVPSMDDIARQNLIARSAFPAEKLEEQNEALPEADYWIENDQYWIRQHVIPRKALLTPERELEGVQIHQC